jgi:class 3 adenylate cyclase
MELLADCDSEEARQLLDPIIEHMMAAVHRYEGTVNQVMGDGIIALFGAPLAHEDHAVRACYAALAMQGAVQQHAAEVQRINGMPIRIRVGLNSGVSVPAGPAAAGDVPLQACPDPGGRLSVAAQEHPPAAPSTHCAGAGITVP